MDPHFGNISVGLYYKDGVCSVWSFSRADGVSERLREIRDRMAQLGGVQPVEWTDNRFIFPCGILHVRPVKFLLTQSVTKARDFAQPGGPMTIKDSKSDLTLRLTGVETEGCYAYEVSGEKPSVPVVIWPRVASASSIDSTALMLRE